MLDGGYKPHPSATWQLSMWVLKDPNPSMFNTYGATGMLGLWVLRGGMVLFICLETHPGANCMLIGGAKFRTHINKHLWGAKY